MFDPSSHSSKSYASLLPTLQNRSFSRWVICCIAVLALLLGSHMLVTAAPTMPPTDQAVHAPKDVYIIYMPSVMNITPFNPTQDVELPGGTYTFSRVDIPENVTVTVTGDVTIRVLQDASIAGHVLADCHAIALTSRGALTITGAFDNRCASDTQEPGDLYLYTNGGTLQVGTADVAAVLNTSGNLDIGNAPDLEDWEFDVLPDQRSDTDLAPVCTAWADTLYGSVLTSTAPISITFYAEGSDPDGGPVDFAWDFGDGGTASGYKAEHTFAAWGTYTIVLTASDDEGQDCQADLQVVIDDSDANIPDAPGVWGGPLGLVVASGQAATFDAVAIDPQDDDLTYLWEFGDGLTATLASPTHTYSLSGRYPVTLTIIDTGGNTVSAHSALYVYTPQQALTENRVNAPTDSCARPTFNAVNAAGAAAAGRDGKKARFRGRGDVFLGGLTDIQAMDGGNGIGRVGAGVVTGGAGGQGGSLYIQVAGSITLCSGASLSAGDGGDGGSADSNTPPPGVALARGGRGGPAAYRLQIAATQGVYFDAASVTIDPGSGGDGGTATANGGNGANRCTTAQDGAQARAIGGNGGKASKNTIVIGNVQGVGFIALAGGEGGDGGDAFTNGGDGGIANCPDTAIGGDGMPGYGRGGEGGNALLGGMTAGMGIGTSFTAGNGGEAWVVGGNGGDAFAAASGTCGSNASATGGDAARGNAYGGKGGKGLTDGNGGNATGVGGDGGDAQASGGDCDICGLSGGNAIATGGQADDGYARFGRRGGSSGANGTARADGGYGGDADAVGGQGGDCPTCPGDGGPGGSATATGGDAADALGNGTNTGGNGGDAEATGGQGGYGADCPCDKLLRQPGGAGGPGGAAIAVGGPAGSPGGVDGIVSGQGGNGGDGGDGNPPGAGGTGGPGTNIPDGLPGADGALSPCPVITIWYIYHSHIPSGAITPGTDIDLPTYTDTVPISPTGIVPAHFMTDDEFQTWITSTETVAYLKDMEGMVYLQPGGIVYTLPDPDIFPTIGMTATVMHSCLEENCVRLIGLYEGEPVAWAGNQATLPVDPEDIYLPPPPAGIPHYDQIILIGSEDFFFNHWWIIIIDP